MTVDVRCRPLDDWSGAFTHVDDRRAARTKASWNTIVDELTREMELLDATEATLGLDVARHQIRADGWPRADASIGDAVLLVFDDNVHGLTLRYQCDRWYPWRGNVRAISLTLTRLRLVAEAGVGVGDEAYRGFAELPAASIELGSGMTAADAYRLLSDAAGVALDARSTPDEISKAYKRAAKRLHPDVGGDSDEWVRVEFAHRMLVP